MGSVPGLTAEMFEASQRGTRLTKRGNQTAGTCSRGPGSVLTSPAAQLGGLPNVLDIQEGFSKRWCLVLQLELLKGA